MTPLPGPDPTRLGRAAAATGGRVLAVATRTLALVRPARKPLHPRGAVVAGRIWRRGSDGETTGVPWLDEPGEDDVVVRLSRAVGLPRSLPDIHGLALRLDQGQQVADLLFATTGRGRLSRFVLTPSREPRSRPMTTLLPYSTDTGGVVLAVEATGPESYELSWARPAGDWHVFGVLRLSSRSASEVEISFDPVRNQLEGLRQYAVVERLREPAYEQARESRDADGVPLDDGEKVG